MQNNKLNFTKDLLFGDIIEIRGDFEYDSDKNIYYQFQNPDILKSEIAWLDYNKIELQFSKDFTKGIYRELFKSLEL